MWNWLKRLWTTDASGFVAVCPECESFHLTLLSRECKGRYDGRRVWSEHTGDRYGCNDCSTVFLLRPDGVKRIAPKVKVEPEKDKRPAPTRDTVQPRLPRVRP